ncbi:MAG: hypothetical protein H7338_21550 [Candidatus Sericytochromatia bacterium]|nr:hypothetical protein [Candidatus Sericytochromatia bacterium]
MWPNEHHVAATTSVAASPLFATYQYRRRDWFDMGPAVGLPVGTDVHTVTLGWAPRLGNVRFELQPGLGWDARLGQAAPLVAAQIAWDVARDAEIRLNGTWSGRSFNQGTGGMYYRLQLDGSWWF